MIDLNNTHRSLAISGLEPDMATDTFGTYECGAYQDRDAPDLDVRSNRPTQLSRGTAYRACASSPARSHLCNGQTSPTGAHDAPVDGECRRNPGSIYRATMPPASVASSLGRDTRCDHPSMSRCSLPLCRLMFAATVRGMSHRRNCADVLCLGFCERPSHKRRTQARLAERAERGRRLSGHAAVAIASRIASSRTHEPVPRDIAGGQPRQSMSNKGGERTALHVIYNRARLMCNV